MHDVAKRSLAVAVAAGGLLINGAAPAVSAVHHPEHPGTPKGQAADSVRAAEGARIPVDRATRHDADIDTDATADAGAEGDDYAYADAAADAEALPQLPKTREPVKAPRHAKRTAQLDATEAAETVAAPTQLDAAPMVDSSFSGGGPLADNIIRTVANLCDIVVTVVGVDSASVGDDCANEVVSPENAMVTGGTDDEAGLGSNVLGRTVDNVIQAMTPPPVMPPPPMNPRPAMTPPMSPPPVMPPPPMTPPPSVPPMAPPSATVTPTLPRTGSNVGDLAAFGVLSLLAGVGAVGFASRKSFS